MSLASENETMRAQIAALQRRLAPMPGAMRDELAHIQARYDSVDAEFGIGAPQTVAPLPFETPHQYRQRRLAGIQRHSPSCKNVRTESLGEAEIVPVEERAIADAVVAAKDPANYKPGEMRAVRFRDEAGRLCTRYVGDSLAWRQHFMTGAQVGRIKSPGEIAMDERA